MPRGHLLMEGSGVRADFCSIYSFLAEYMGCGGKRPKT
jgi:hypothetical protein